MKIVKFAAGGAPIAVFSFAALAQKMKTEEIVAKHAVSNGAGEVEWNLNQFVFNQTLDAKTFDAGAN